MALKNKFSCLWTLGLCLIASKPAKILSNKPKVPTIKDPYFIEEWVSHHNDWRGKVNPPAANMKYMSWDKDLARLAKSWTDKCKFSHNPCTAKRRGCYDAFDYVGENIFLDVLEHSPEFVITYWYNESKNYNFDDMSCSENDCGHYTQVVWATSYKLGCAVTNCPSLGGESTALFACNYAPAGNERNKRPYIKGKSCSQCSKNDSCVNNACCLCLITSKLEKINITIAKVPTIKDPHFIEEWVNHHNDWRGKVKPPAANMKYMIWDKDLAKLAKSWSNRCKLKHNPCTKRKYACTDAFDYVGENMFLGGLEFSPEYIISTWYNESKDYNFDDLSCSNVCSHYIQMVWATSRRLGCAVTNCPHLGESSMGLFICNYAPVRNGLSRYPYIKGESCSQCSSDEECLNNLCYHIPGRAPQHIAYHLLTLGFILQRIF